VKYLFFQTDLVDLRDVDGSVVLEVDGSAVEVYLSIGGTSGGTITSIVAPAGGVGRF
jgi:fructose-1,6-bisphosphatase/sedoheptulose 1,7-bisphosphatase-like protein